FPPAEIASAGNGDKAVKYLLETFERLAGRATKHAERNTLMVIIEEIKLPCEVAVMLVNYCFEIDKATPAYMKTAALDWYESGIDTIGKAEERIRALKQRFTLENKLRVKFGMNSAFSAKQKEIIEGWAGMELPDSLIDAAYDKTLNGAGKLSFPYMDKILRKWHEEGITDPAQLEKQKKQEASEGGSSFDISELEQSAYQRYKKH
ncbi:MAG: DnaD domain protein, partial [Ruminiclostridium sp.]